MLFLLLMASSSATHNITSIVIDDNIDEDGNDLLSTTKALRSHQTSNVEVDVAWVFLLHNLWPIKKSKILFLSIIR
jgi:hypothetical protein